MGGISFENFEQINFGITCFAAGTLIETSGGNVPIETLTAGDCVLTMDDGYRPIRWIGSQALSRRDLTQNPKLNPIRIRAGALGYGPAASKIFWSPPSTGFWCGRLWPNACSAAMKC